MKTIAYIRVSTLEQNVDSQIGEIKRYADYKQIKIDEFITITMSSRKEEGLRRIDELKSKLEKGDILISSELSRLGRSMVEVVQLVHELVKRGIRVILIKNNIDSGFDGKLNPTEKFNLGIFSALAEMERDLISLRTKEGLIVAKAKGNVGGRRKGTLYLSIYDKHLPKIKEYLLQEIPLTNIVKLIGEGHAVTLSDYLAKRNHRVKSLSGQAIKNLKKNKIP